MSQEVPRSVLRNRRVDYLPLGLNGNPFPIAGIADPHSPFPLVESVLDEDVHAFMSDTLNAGQFCGLLILGEYGAGKTYALRYLETVLRTCNTNPDAEEILTVYVNRPSPSIAALVKDVCDRIGLWPFRTIVRQIFVSGLVQLLAPDRQDSAARKSELAKALAGRVANSLFPSDPLGELACPDAALNPSPVFARLQSQGCNLLVLADTCTDLLTDAMSFEDERARDIAKHLAALALDLDSKAERHWDSLFDAGGARRAKATMGNYPQVIWSCLRALLRQSGYRMVYWFLDEFEELEVDIPRQHEIRAFLTDFRNLIDANLEGFAVVVASKSHSWDFQRQLNPGFAQRISRVVVLGPLTQESLRQLIVRRLDTVRKTAEDRGSAEPFSADAVGALLTASKGNARSAVQMCHFLLWYAATNERRSIAADLVAQINVIGNAFHEAQKQGGR